MFVTIGFIADSSINFVNLVFIRESHRPIGQVICSRSAVSVELLSRQL